MNLYVKSYRHSMSCIAGYQTGFWLLKNKALIMRISILAILLTFSGLLMARSGSGQDLNKIMITVDLKDATLKQAFKKIESLTQLVFTYRTVDVAAFEHINYQASNVSVTRILEDLLQHTGLRYDQVNSNIIIKKIRKKEQLADVTITDVLPFDGGIRGRVTDETGAPIPNASIVLLGTDKGTAADTKGEFVLMGVKPGDYRLQVSAIGFQTFIRNVSINDEAIVNVDVELQAGNNKLDEVVVTALGIKREKRSLGYSAQEIKGEELTNTRQTNILNALRGKVAGVQINSGGGAPGQGSRIIIRGIKSLSPGKNNQPLFVIDGILIDNSTTTVNDAGSLRGLTNRAADINPDDIESMSILKGGAATALYGQAGSNGVVVITTKSAKAGKMRVSFTTSYGIDEVNKFPEVQKKFTQGYVGATSFVPEYDPKSFWPSWGPTVEEAKAIDPTHPNSLYNHYGQGFKTGNQFRTSINLSGGTEKALLTSSVSYFKQNGVLPNSDYKNISARLGGQFKFSDKLKFSPGLYFINSGGYRVNADRYNESLTYWSPRWNVMDYVKPDGTQNAYGNDNPVYGTATNRFKDNVNRIIGNVALTYSPLQWFDVDYKFGMDYYADFRRHAAPGPKGLVGEQVFGDNGLGFVNEYRLSNRILTSNVMATFKKEWFRKLNTTLRIGNEVRDRRYSRLTAAGTELDIPDLLSLNNAKVRSTTQYEEKYRIVSAYGDLTLGWSDYLFLNITGRNEWSSTLPVASNSFFYPSASLSYVFSDHLTMPLWLNFGKARVSVAEVGKDTDPYEINKYYGSGVITSTGQIMWTRSDQAGDALLKPERTSTIEAGVELKLFNRIGLDFSWYKLNSRDQIIPVSLSPTTGFTSYILNAGEIENKGIEVVLTSTPVKTKDFTWNTTLNYTRNRNKVVSIREGLSEIVVGSHFGYSSSTATLKYVPGSAVGNIYGTSYQRYYGSKTDDGVTVDKSLPVVINASGSNAGFPARDTKQRILGNSQPNWIGGITNTFTYKDFTLSFLWETQQGQDRYNQLGNFMSAFGIAKYTENRTETIVFNGVLPDGTVNAQAVYLGMGKVGGTGRDYGQGFYRNVHRGVTENFVEDASWVRLRNVNLGYTVPNKFFKGTPIQGVSVTFTGNNLLLFTNYSGYDPETSSSSAESNADGFTGFTYPALRSYLFSVNINF
ncbi:SusC/RagA family TonB-linked outer membrane protein [Niastella caeni]|uniref:SusC/RagA family TonB-linked outer membrane protein n=2 Tax=Niastella caeni TaxID=2569763 RepID=A0A4S8I4N2_9BACT|nr:SusC/RagA family TonB-linked outer membrane protein [Niastella caeni]